MSRIPALAALAAGTALFSQPVFAHGFAGAHLFVSTLILDDPNVADEASLPTFSFLPLPSSADPAPLQSILGFEYDKRITENFGFAINDGYAWLRQPGNKTANGWQDLSVTLKYKPYVNAEHEFMMSIGVERDFARTGANGTNGALLDNADVGSTTPLIYFGKGFGDIPVGWLRPFAITGEFGYQFSDKKLTVDQTGAPSNNGAPNIWTGGLSLQYSIRYLESQVKDYGLPEFINRLTPLIELAWTSPASQPNNFAPTTYLFAPGINYTATDYAVGLEALIPGNKQTGSHIGFIAQFHLYFDDMFPTSLGKPIVDWW
jgi:hypothetical protein